MLPKVEIFENGLLLSCGRLDGRKWRFLNMMMSYIIQRTLVVLGTTVRAGGCVLFLNGEKRYLRFQKYPDKCGRCISSLTFCTKLQKPILWGPWGQEFFSAFFALEHINQKHISLRTTPTWKSMYTTRVQKELCLNSDRKPLFRKYTLLYCF